MQQTAVDVAFLAYLTITIEFCPTLFRKPNVHLVNKFLASLATLSPRRRSLGWLGRYGAKQTHRMKRLPGDVAGIEFVVQCFGNSKAETPPSDHRGGRCWAVRA